MKANFQGRFGTMLYVTMGCFGMTLQCQTVTSAQSSPEASTEKLWQQLQNADNHIHSCRVTWRRVVHITANPKVNVEKRSAQAAEQARQNHESDKDVQSATAMARQSARKDAAGYQLVSMLSFVRVGMTTRCEIETNFASEGISPAKKTKTFEFYDGKNSLSGDIEVMGIKVPMNGQLVRDEREILSQSAATWQMPRFLLGLPLEQKLTDINPSLSPQNTSLRSGADNTFVLERKVEPQTGKIGIEYPGILRLVVSKEHFRPVSYELTNMLYAEKGGRVIGHVDISEYQRYADGIWFPSKVKVTTAAYTMDYNLIKVAFNEAVDPMEVRLPAGIRIADARFGLTKIVVYQPKDGLLPSDDEVRKMLGEKVEKEKAATDAKAPTLEKGKSPISSLSITPVAGLLLMAFGCVLWGRSRHDGGNS